MMKPFILFLIVSGALRASAQDTTTIFFDLGKSTLTPGAKHIIDSALYVSDLPLSSLVKIYGYTDSIGDTAYNRKLSYDRAQSVKTHLVSSGIPEKLITTIMGLGEKETRGRADYALNRRVDIVRGGKQKNDGTNSLHSEGMKVGETFVISNIYFFPSTSSLKPQSQNALTQLYEILKQKPTLKIRIEGHTCCSFKLTDKDYLRYFQNLSQQRAGAVYEYLISKGIERSRLSFIGLGGTKPLVYPELRRSDEERNMRVEIRIMAI
jgi:outer membrane protein OmpA-like peptidoglycan-associated protein